MSAAPAAEAARTYAAGEHRLFVGGRQVEATSDRLLDVEDPSTTERIGATPAANDSEIVQREVFGPVLTLQTYDGEAEGIELANSTPYGLSAVICTRSAERAQRVGRAVRAGTTWVNAFLVRDLTAPFGGMGISGIGREGGDYALDFYSDLKTLQILEDTTA